MFHKFLPFSYSCSSGRCGGDRPIGSPLRQTAEQFRQARVVRITRGVFAVGLDPFGMLDPQAVLNLLLELGVGVNLVRHGNP